MAQPDSARVSGSTLEVARSNRYGKPRLYVFLDGRRLGYLDLLTGQQHVPQSDDAVDFERALAEYRAAHPRTKIPSPASRPRHASPGDPLEPGAPAPVVPAQRHSDWTDLAGNAAGACLASKAEQITREAVAGTAEAESWLIGARGETRTAAALEPLTAHGWYLINSVTLNSRGTDLDHLLIGPGGVFTINTKTHPQARVGVYEHMVYVNGAKHVSYLHAAQHEAKRVAATLGAALRWQLPFIVPTLVFVDTAKLSIKAQPLPVYVLAVDQALDYFASIPMALQGEQVEAIQLMARRSTTWA